MKDFLNWNYICAIEVNYKMKSMALKKDRQINAVNDIQWIVMFKSTLKHKKQLKNWSEYGLIRLKFYWPQQKYTSKKLLKYFQYKGMFCFLCHLV